VNVQLVNAQTDSQIWAETYDPKLSDIFSVESAARVAKERRLTGGCVVAAGGVVDPAFHKLCDEKQL
jgi:hypothetical protein